MQRPLFPLGRRASGFTLIELLVAVAVVGILAAIAYPAYTQHVIKAKRAAAQAYLLNLSQAQTEYFADARTYATTTAELNMPPPETVSAKYQIRIDVTEGPPATYLLTATPIAGSSQASDVILTVDNSGARTPADKW